MKTIGVVIEQAQATNPLLDEMVWKVSVTQDGEKCEVFQSVVRDRAVRVAKALIDDYVTKGAL